MEMSISLKCSVCANDQFSTVVKTIEYLLDAPDETLIKCSDCGRVVTKEELIEENSHIIDANLEGTYICSVSNGNEFALESRS